MLGVGALLLVGEFLMLCWLLEGLRREWLKGEEEE